MRDVFLFLLAALAPAAARAAEAPFQPHYVSQRAGQAYLREGPGYATRFCGSIATRAIPSR